jgi:hypothetical protein
MCPICITTGALIATGASSAGGLTALAAKVLRTRSKAKLRGTPSSPAARAAGAPLLPQALFVNPIARQPGTGAEHGTA